METEAPELHTPMKISNIPPHEQTSNIAVQQPPSNLGDLENEALISDSLDAPLINGADAKKLIYVAPKACVDELGMESTDVNSSCRDSAQVEFLEQTQGVSPNTRCETPKSCTEITNEVIENGTLNNSKNTRADCVSGITSEDTGNQDGEHSVDNDFNPIRDDNFTSSDTRERSSISHALNSELIDSSKTFHEESSEFNLSTRGKDNVQFNGNKLSSIPDCPDDVISLHDKVEDLTQKLLRSQEHLESLLAEKQRWLTNLQQQPPSCTKSKSTISSDTAAVVVKFAQSEQQRMKAESKVKELELVIAQLKTKDAGSSDLATPNELCVPIEELNKALTEARERAEHLRHALRQEEARVGDLSTRLAATHEAHRNEQKRVAGQAEMICKLNREIDSLKQQLKEANKVREREAKRLCDEMIVRETTEKYNRALSEIATLQERITHLEEVQKSKVELEGKYDELQKAHDSLLSVREEMASCVERETQLSEFTRRLTERNAGLQTAHLATQARLEASERAVGEASRAAQEATDLLLALEKRSTAERVDAANTIARLESQIVELTQSNETLRAALTSEQVEKAALKRKQHALDREFARLMAQQRKRSQQTPTDGTLHQDAASEGSPTNSSLSITGLTKSDSLDPSVSSSPPSVLGSALLVAPESRESVATSMIRTAGEGVENSVGISALEVQTLEPHRVLLLNKIDRLQRTNVRLMEKIDFMHEHIGQLTRELQKKSQILQHCLVRATMNDGAAVPSAVDANKRQRMRRGGTLMAAVFAGDGDTASDLRTSLQLNQKLQSVLEDTLYKNLTLKENVDTLAEEVANLKKANEQLKTLAPTLSDPLASDPHR